jgi:hypothetical protein
MDSLSTTFLGVIAFSGVVQALCFAVAGIVVLRLVRKAEAALDRMAGRVDTVARGVDRLSRRTANLSDLALERTQRVEPLLGRATSVAQRTTARASGWLARRAGEASVLALGSIFRGVGLRRRPADHDLGRPLERWEESQHVDMAGAN